MRSTKRWCLSASSGHRRRSVRHRAPGTARASPRWTLRGKVRRTTRLAGRVLLYAGKPDWTPPIPPSSDASMCVKPRVGRGVAGSARRGGGRGAGLVRGLRFLGVEASRVWAVASRVSPWWVAPPSQARAVTAGAFHADALHAAQAAQPSPQLLIAGSRRRQRRCAQQPSRRIHRCCGVRVAVGVHPADNGSIPIWHNRPALPGTLPMDRAPPAATTHSALTALEPTLLSGHIPSDPLVRAPDRTQADRSFSRHQASEAPSQARTRRERTSIMSAKSPLCCCQAALSWGGSP